MIPSHLKAAYDRARKAGQSHADACAILSIPAAPAPTANGNHAAVLASLAPATAQPIATTTPTAPTAFAGWARDKSGKVVRADGVHASLSEALEFSRAERGQLPRAAAQAAQPQPTAKRQPSDLETRQARALQISSAGKLRMTSRDGSAAPVATSGGNDDRVRQALRAWAIDDIPLAEACAMWGVPLPADPAR